jgi:hypothetical protein
MLLKLFHLPMFLLLCPCARPWLLCPCPRLWLPCPRARLPFLNWAPHDSPGRRFSRAAGTPSTWCQHHPTLDLPTCFWKSNSGRAPHLWCQSQYLSTKGIGPTGAWAAATHLRDLSQSLPSLRQLPLCKASAQPLPKASWQQRLEPWTALSFQAVMLWNWNLQAVMLWHWNMQSNCHAGDSLVRSLWLTAHLKTICKLIEMDVYFNKILIEIDAYFKKIFIEINR